MANKYNAFISYKHSDLDNRVASEIQRQLERFKIPKSIKESTKTDKINRIFRDKEELTLTSDLSASIENALSNSDNLIVICSPATKESVWVQREIEFFLKTHSRNQILTVVTDGEPCDVVPEILQYKEEKVIDASGNTVITKVPTEFLACDYRGELKRANKDELPRLAAALLGCNYDDLIQRQKQYKRKVRRTYITIALALLITLTTYFAYSTIRINKNYKQSLLNQSEYLAAEAQKLYDNGDRVSAGLLALEALPSKDNDRPLSGNALNALSNSIYAYRPPGINSPLQSKRFLNEGDVNDFAISSDNKYLAVKHNLYNLTVWDIETGQEVMNKVFSNTISQISFAKDNKMIVLTDSLYCYDLNNNNELWMLNDISESSFSLLSEKNMIVYSNTKGLSLVDINSGKTSKELTVKGLGEFEYVYFSDYAVSQQENFVASTNTDGDIYVWDLEKETYKKTNLDTEYIIDIKFISDDRLATISTPSVMNESQKSELSIGNSVIYKDTVREIHCYDINANLKWNDELVFNQLTFESHLCSGVYTSPDGKNYDAVFFTSGNLCLVSDIESGEVLDKIEMPDPILHTKVDNGSVDFLLSSGLYSIYRFSDSFCCSVRYFVDNLESGIIDDVTFVVPENSNGVYMYEYGLYDDNWISCFDNNDNLSFSSNGTQIGNYILFYELNNSQYDVYCYDIYKNCISSKATFNDYLSTNSFCSPFIKTDNPDEVLILASNGVYLFNMYSSDKETIIYNDGYSLNIRQAYYHNGYLYYITATKDPETFEKTNDICRTDIITKKTDILYKDVTEKYFYFNAFPEHSLYMTWDYDDPEFKLDLLYNDEEIKLDSIAYPEFSAVTDDGKHIVLLSETDIQIYDNEMNLQHEISMENKAPVSAHIIDNKLLVAYKTDEISIYDLKKGKKLTTTALNFTYSTGSIFWDDSENGKLLVNAHNCMNVYDTKNFELLASVDYCVGFDHSKNAAFVFGSNIEDTSKDELGYFKIYSPEQLIEKATRMLEGNTLTESQKREYSIQD